MKGLLLKDFLTFRKPMIVVFIFIVALYSIIFSKDIGILSTLAFTMPFVITYLSVGMDEQSNWNSYAVSMPISRKNLVLSKYVLWIVLNVLGLLILIVTSIFIENTDFRKILLLFVFEIIMLSIMLPCILKYGMTKGFLGFIVVILIFGVILAVMYLISQLPQNHTYINIIKHVIIIVAIILPLTFLAISMKISIGIYSKKDF